MLLIVPRTRPKRVYVSKHVRRFVCSANGAMNIARTSPALICINMNVLRAGSRVNFWSFCAELAECENVLSADFHEICASRTITTWLSDARHVFESIIESHARHYGVRLPKRADYIINRYI